MERFTPAGVVRPADGRLQAAGKPARVRIVKEDVLEQIVDDYLQLRGYFTRHNIRFRPRPDHPDYVSQQDSVTSDVDVVGYNPCKPGPERVMVVSCKAWQPGFDASAKLAELRNEKINPKRETWRHFRELWSPKWAEAFHDEICDLTGVKVFSYRLAVTRLKGDGDAWAADPTILANLAGCPFKFLTLEEMWTYVLEKTTTTPAPSDMGRLAQLLKAAGLT